MNEMVNAAAGSDPGACGDLGPAFPGASKFYERRLDGVLPILVQSLPLVATAAAWLYVELIRRKRNVPRRVQLSLRWVAFACMVTTSVVVWRIAELITCDDSQDTVLWGIVSVVGSVGTSGIVLGLVAARVLRVAILIALVFAAACVVADVLLRELNATGPRMAAAAHFATMQNVCNLHAACLLFAIPQSRRARAVRTSVPSAPKMFQVDALA